MHYQSDDTMPALVATEDDGLSYREVPTPDGDTLVETLRVGIDGTDRETRRRGADRLPDDQKLLPDGQDYMVIGHEAVGRVAESDTYEAGRLVVPTVRRPYCDCPQAERGRPDYCPPDHHRERGIKQLDGFCSAYFAEEADHLVPLPDGLEELGVLVEPLSVVEKGILDADAAQKRLGDAYEPETGLVLGAGTLGLLATMLLEERGMDVYTLDRVDASHPKAEIVDAVGATYVDGRDTALDALPAPDLAVEATGASEQLFAAMDHLAPNGTLISFGIPQNQGRYDEVASGRFHIDTVVKNKMLIGSVNSSVPHFEAAIDDLHAFHQDYPVEQMLDVQTAPDDWETAFDAEIKGEIVFQ